MTLDRMLLIPLGIGHLALFIVAMNAVHGLGYDERVMRLAKLTLLTLFVGGSCYLTTQILRGSIEAWSIPTVLYSGLCIATGAVLVPGFTAYLHLRPRPVTCPARAEEVDLAAIDGRDRLIGEGRFSNLLRWPGNESLRLRKVQWDLPVENLHPALDGLSILHFSDLHLARCYDRRFFERVIEEAATLEADLHLFTGDLVDDDDAVEWVALLFSELPGRMASFGVLGNHDLDHRPGEQLLELEKAGYGHLEGRWATVEVDGARVAIGGTSYPWGPRLGLDDRPEADYSIFLSHAPDQFYWAEKAGFDLMLSGHNHGGQIRLPLVGSVFMPSVYSRRFDRGFFQKRKLVLHVSQGVGADLPYRYGCTPEVGRIVLRRVAVSGDSARGDRRPRTENRAVGLSTR